MLPAITSGQITVPIAETFSLENVADAYEREVDDSVSTLFRIIEPIIILFLAVVVGTIVVALFMPILKVMDSLSAR